MECCKKCGNNFLHFVFYSSTTCEKTPNENNGFLVEELGKKFTNKGVFHLCGAHQHHYFNQCGFNDHALCISIYCEEQSGEKHYGLRPFINPPTSPDATSNQINLLKYCNNAPHSGTFTMSACETQGVNWTLQGTIQTFKEIFVHSFCTESLSGYRAIQKQACRFFSLFAVFCV